MTSTPCCVEPLDDLLRAVDPLLLGALAGGRDRLEVDPVAADVEVLGVARARTTSRPRGRSRSRASAAAALASATPAIPSWSVSAITVTPASAAARATSAGASWPSETVEWDWRSIMGAQLVAITGCAAFLTLIATMAQMRISAKADYAVRATLELAARRGRRAGQGRAARRGAGDPAAVPRAHPARAQARPAGPGASAGLRGGYWLARPADEITLADVIRAVEGPLANIHEYAPEETALPGPRGAAARRLGRGAGQPARGARGVTSPRCLGRLP